MLSDRDIINWDQRLKEQADRGWDNYIIKRIDLSLERNNQPSRLPGEFLIVSNVSSSSAAATVRFSDYNNKELDLEKRSIFRTVFVCLYVTNAVQAGQWIDIVVGINFEYYRNEVGEAQACMILTNVGVGNVAAAAHSCNRVLIRAHKANAGTIWTDFGQAGVVDACYELTAGDAISVPCLNTGRINGWFTNGGDKATIVYEA